MAVLAGNHTWHRQAAQHVWTKDTAAALLLLIQALLHAFLPKIDTPLPRHSFSTIFLVPTPSCTIPTAILLPLHEL